MESRSAYPSSLQPGGAADPYGGHVAYHGGQAVAPSSSATGQLPVHVFAGAAVLLQPDPAPTDHGGSVSPFTFTPPRPSQPTYPDGWQPLQGVPSPSRPVRVRRERFRCGARGSCGGLPAVASSPAVRRVALPVRALAATPPNLRHDLAA